MEPTDVAACIFILFALTMGAVAVLRRKYKSTTTEEISENIEQSEEWD